MSVISNVHQFVKLDKDSAALSGQRLIRLIAKKDKAGNYQSENLTESLCVSVPMVNQEQLIESIDKLLPHVVGFIQDTQDKIVREWRLEHGRNEIPEHVFSVDACVAWLDENSAGDRVSKEYLQEWFLDQYKDVAALFIEQAIGGTVSTDIVSAKTNVLRDMFAGFAGAKYSPNIPSCKAMVRFVQFATENDCADARLIQYGAKAGEIQARKEAELSADALGF